MRRWMLGLLITAVMLPWSALAQEQADPEATISALQTEVARLQSNAGTPTPIPATAEAATQEEQAASSSDSETPDTSQIVNLEIILDVSGSMGQIIDTGETRMEAAKRVLNEVMAAIPDDPGVNVGLRIYGHLGDNTEAGRPVSGEASELIVPIAGVDRQAIAQQMAPLVPTGWTPIATSLERSAADFQESEMPATNVVVLVTDGLETCDGDPAAAAASLATNDLAITTHVIGFALTPEEQQLLQSITDASGGMLLSAANALDLSSALFSVLEELEIVVGQGYVGGNAFPLVPTGEPGTLAVVAIGQFDASGSILPVVVRNNTSEDVVDVKIAAVAQDAEGRVLSTGSSQFVRPFHVRPGTLALGYVYFGGIAVPPEAQIELEVDGTAPSEARFNQTRDLDMIEASLFEDRVVGQMENEHRGIVEGPIGVSVVCFNLDGTLVSHHQAFVDPNEVIPDEAVAFQTVLYAPSGGCPAFLVAGSGFCPTCPATVDAGTVPEATVVSSEPQTTPVPPAADATEEPVAAPDPANLALGAFDIYFEPRFLEVPANVDTVIEITNNGVTTHNFSVDQLGISVDVPSGESETVTINAPAGTYDFYCNVPGHSAAGMVGSLLAQ